MVTNAAFVTHRKILAGDHRTLIYRGYWVGDHETQIYRNWINDAQRTLMHTYPVLDW